MKYGNVIYHGEYLKKLLIMLSSLTTITVCCVTHCGALNSGQHCANVFMKFEKAFYWKNIIAAIGIRSSFIPRENPIKKQKQVTTFVITCFT
jgi:hypothetical protein